jgi:hypothetical protein
MDFVVFFCAFLSTLFFCRISDITGKRAITLIATLLLSLIGYIMLLASDNQRVRFAGAVFVASGNYPGEVLVYTWMIMSSAGYTTRATMTATIKMIGQCLSIAGNEAYQDAPFYRKGLAASLGMLGLELIAVLGTSYYLKWRNYKKELEKNSPEADQKRLIDIDIIGADHPDFRFMY